MPDDRHQFAPYWNKNEVFSWIVIAVVLTGYAVAVLVYGVNPDPVSWLE